MTQGDTTITGLLRAAQRGDREALSALFPLMYGELRAMAHHQRVNWQGDLTLNTTALVHEAYLKLVDQKRIVAESRGHFFALAAKAMRHILCNYARDRRRLKRGGDARHVALEDGEASFAVEISDGQADQLAALDEALASLERADRRQSEIVECRFFGGLSIEDTAAALGISPATVKRDWATARTWLERALSGSADSASGDLDALGEQVVAPAQVAVAGSMRSRADARLRDRLAAALASSHRIGRQLPGGGMSRVFVAEEIADERTVVIKVFSIEIAVGVSADRFRREIQLASRLRHPRIVPLLGNGSTDVLLYYTMPFVDGESLKERLARVGRLPVSDAVGIWRDVLEALAYAHASGVVHRDIKPANILVAGRDAFVTDFGIARAIQVAARDAQESGDVRTVTGMVVGTPAYMAPEQAAGDRSADHRVDIYAAGLVMYEMLAGRSPFRETSDTELMQAQFTRAPDHLNRSDAPPALERLVQQCLAKNPADRPQTSNAVLTALAAVGSR